MEPSAQGSQTPWKEEEPAGSCQALLPPPAPSISLQCALGRAQQGAGFRAQTGRCWGEEDIHVGKTVTAGIGDLLHMESLMASVTRPRTMGARVTTVRKGRTKALQNWIRSGGSSENSWFSMCGHNRCAHTHGSPAVSMEGQEAASPQQEASLGKDVGF